MNDNDGFAGIAAGLLIGILIGGVISAFVGDHALAKCAKIHNVYACEWVTVPKENKQ